MSTSVYTCLNPFNFIRKDFQRICFWVISLCTQLLQFLTHSTCVDDHVTLQILLLPQIKVWLSKIQWAGHKFLVITSSSTAKTTVSNNGIKQLHTLPVLHLNRCLTTEYSETTAHCNGNFVTDNQMYVK
jgi:hypothetical protein